MTTVADVLGMKKMLTSYEYSIITCQQCTIMTIIALLIVVIDLLIRYGISGIFYLFTDTPDIMMIGFLCWIFFLAWLFLRGYLYIQRFNKAVYYGMRSEAMHFHGVIIDKIRNKWASPYRNDAYIRYLVQLDNGKIVSTPYYAYVPDEAYDKCEVYFYQKKYYFTDFRQLNQIRKRWWSKYDDKF